MGPPHSGGSSTENKIEELLEKITSNWQQQCLSCLVVVSRQAILCKYWCQKCVSDNVKYFLKVWGSNELNKLILSSADDVILRQRANYKP